MDKIVFVFIFKRSLAFSIKIALLSTKSYLLLFLKKLNLSRWCSLSFINLFVRLGYIRYLVAPPGHGTTGISSAWLGPSQGLRKKPVSPTLTLELFLKNGRGFRCSTGNCGKVYHYIISI